jgi:hypothetical protein
MATRLESAIARVIKEAKVRTYDMGGSASTLDSANTVSNYAASLICPPFGRTRRGEGGKDSTLDVAKAIAEDTSS